MNTNNSSSFFFFFVPPFRKYTFIDAYVCAYAYISLGILFLESRRKCHLQTFFGSVELRAHSFNIRLRLFSKKKKKEKEGFMCSPHEVTCANFSKFCYHYTLDISVPMSWCGVIIPEPVLK